ncbi:hypothetical protein ACGFMM_24905 [Streptomyces sp. NPDC048604]|uniref:hypothetical protein n=1 Tax=Streptomyces sp. NPDC048604 TaxID=3365578 RepID=UPI00371F20E5
MAAASALVGLAATDGYQQARDGLVALWHRVRPGQAAAVAGDLDALGASADVAEGSSGALVALWQTNVQALLALDESLRPEVRQLVQGVLLPLLSEPEQRNVGALLQQSDIADGRAAGGAVTGNYFQAAAPFQTGEGSSQTNHFGPAG